MRLQICIFVFAHTLCAIAKPLPGVRSVTEDKEHIGTPAVDSDNRDDHAARHKRDLVDSNYLYVDENIIYADTKQSNHRRLVYDADLSSRRNTPNPDSVKTDSVHSSYLPIQDQNRPQRRQSGGEAGGRSFRHNYASEVDSKTLLMPPITIGSAAIHPEVQRRGSINSGSFTFGDKSVDHEGRRNNGSPRVETETSQSMDRRRSGRRCKNEQACR